MSLFTHRDPFFFASSRSSVDLRAVLRIQPSNREALAELASLIPLTATKLPNGSSIDVSSHGDDSNPSTSKQQQPSAPGSPSPSTKMDDPRSLQRLGIPKPKPIKQPSFARTKSDDRRLKIVLMSSAATAAGGGGGDSSGRNRGGSGHSQTNGKENVSATTISRHGKEKAGALRSQKKTEMERMKAECVLYPSWDRYEVKRVD